MTFGYGSPGFDPFYCPPCPEGMWCNTVCLDPIDGPVLILGMVVAFVTVGFITQRRYDDGE